MSAITYNFDKIIPREGTASVKYDLRHLFFKLADVFPMWVADMDFETPDFIRYAVVERAMHPIFGYTFRDEDYHTAIIDWMHRRHDWEIQKEWMLFTPGVVPALNIAVLALTQAGDKIIVQPPVYFPFFTAVKDHGRELVYNQLKLEQGQYSMDFDLLEQQAKDAKMLLLSNPHNPVGRAWTRSELEKLADICLRNNVLVLSDEIHNDLVLPPHRHQVFAALSDEAANISLTAHAASKTFNIAGLASSTMIISNPAIRAPFEKLLKALHVDMGNLFGFAATKAAFTHGDQWLEQLIAYIDNNIAYTKSFLEKHLPRIYMHQPEATYMIWLDFSAYGFADEELSRILEEKAGLGLSPGHVFGPGGSGFMRLNVACPFSQLQTALEKMRMAFEG